MRPHLLQIFYYRYHYTADNQKLVQLSFTPRNTNDILFEGDIYITLDGNYAVQKAALPLTKTST
jgi:hypothetical protein